MPNEKGAVMQKKTRQRASKVDYRLLYKRRVMDFLTVLKDKDYTTWQMDESMKKLFLMSDQVIPVCLAKLRENDEEFTPIACYALEYANDYTLVEPLMHILIMPGVSDKIKARILGVLSHYGVDASELPLDIIMEDFDKMASDSLVEMLSDVERDYFTIPYVLDDMTGFTTDMKIAYVKDIGQQRDERSLYLLEIIATIDDPPVAQEAVKALGKIKSGKALYSLNKLEGITADEELKKLIGREAQRLKFSGIPVEVHSPPWAKLQKPVKIFVSSIDGLGSRALWMAWKNPVKRARLGFMNLLLNTDTGVKDCWGVSQISTREFNSSVKDFSKTATVAECDSDYAAALIGDALLCNAREGYEIPYQFYFWKSLLRQSLRITPHTYKPAFEGFDLEALAQSEEHLKKTFDLFDYRFFNDWFIAEPRVYDYADENKSKRGFVLKKMTQQKAEKLFSKFTQELIEPFADTMKRMLELSADFLCLIGDQEAAEIAISAFIHMDVRPLHYHPFVQRMVLESLKIALSNMKNGFDMRVDPDAFI